MGNSRVVVSPSPHLFGPKDEEVEILTVTAAPPRRLVPPDELQGDPRRLVPPDELQGDCNRGAFCGLRGWYDLHWKLRLTAMYIYIATWVIWYTCIYTVYICMWLVLSHEQRKKLMNIFHTIWSEQMRNWRFEHWSQPKLFGWKCFVFHNLLGGSSQLVSG